MNSQNTENPKDIRKVDCIKLYYPFLRNKISNKKRPLNQGDLKRFKTYLLFADKIVIPPHDIINREFALQNSKFFLNSELQSIPIDEIILFTATEDNISTVGELIEYYSDLDKVIDTDLKKLFFPIIRLATFYRDEIFQREQYAFFLKNNIEKIPKEINKEILELIKKKPRHEEVIQQLPMNELSTNTKSQTYGILMTAYHFAGKEGNNAIVPPTGYLDLPPAYNPMYAFEVVNAITKIIIGKLGLGSIDLLSIKDIKRLNQYITLFRDKYFKISRAYDQAFTDIDSAISEILKTTQDYFSFRRSLSIFLYSLFGTMFIETIKSILQQKVKIAIDNLIVEEALSLLFSTIADKLGVKNIVEVSFESLTNQIKNPSSNQQHKKLLNNLKEAYNILEKLLENILHELKEW